MKKVKAAVVGYGDRGARYCEYAHSHPEEMQVIAAVDPNPLKLSQAKAAFNIPDDMLFTRLEDFLAKKVECDVVINATMDQIHYATTLPLLRAKYNVLLEKPVTAVPEELVSLQQEAQKNGCILMVCHVLRYVAFYLAIKRLLLENKIGEITNMQLNEHIGLSHFVKAYVRGKWRNEKQCGSGLLLAKCCHDLDLICWLNNAAQPFAVSSFGAKATYSTDKAPKGSAEYCWECPVRDSCLYDAYEFELEHDTIPFYTWADINKPLDTITREEKIEFLKTNVYGRCVYRTDMDIVDRQCVSIMFENGSVATLNMVGAAAKAGRNIHILGTLGEIEGNIEDGRLILRTFGKGNLVSEETQISLEDVQGTDNAVTGHYGGDYYIMKDLVRYLNGQATSISTTVIEDSINGHLCCYAAEKARIEEKVVRIAEYK